MICKVSATVCTRWRTSERYAARDERHGDVLEHRQVRVESIVLEHHRHVAVLRRQFVDADAVEQDITEGYRLKSGKHPQGG